MARLRALVRLARERVRDDQLGVHAGSLTYGAFLAIPPLLVLGLSVLSLVLASDLEAQQRLIEDVASLVPGLEEVIGSQFELASAQQLGIGIAGVLALLWAVSSFAARTRTALATIFRTGPPTLLTARLSGTALGLVSLVGLAFIAVAAGWADGAPGLLRPLAIAAVMATGLGVFLFVYWALTPPGPGRPSVREHLPGAIAFLVAGLTLERVGAAYVSAVIAKATALYGTIGAIFGLLAFLYMAMWAFLLGAALSQIVRERDR